MHTYVYIYIFIHTHIYSTQKGSTKRKSHHRASSGEVEVEEPCRPLDRGACGRVGDPQAADEAQSVLWILPGEPVAHNDALL